MYCHTFRGYSGENIAKEYGQIALDHWEAVKTCAIVTR